eukprot:jgi/Ulvmu1/11276/UM073_0048.1
MSRHLRTYQQEALSCIARQSTIVVLPTGSGKTLIAAKAAERECLATSQPTLFLVPTQYLVDQQSQALQRDTSLRIARFHGGLSPPSLSTLHVLVATPAALLAQAQLYSLTKFGLIVFDEVHHAAKKHHYMKVVDRMKGIPACSRPKVLGLSASLSFSVLPGVLHVCQSDYSGHQNPFTVHVLQHGYHVLICITSPTSYITSSTATLMGLDMISVGLMSTMSPCSCPTFLSTCFLTCILNPDDMYCMNRSSSICSDISTLADRQWAGLYLAGIVPVAVVDPLVRRC